AVWTEPTAADRSLELLRTAYGSDWSPSLLDTLLTGSGCRPGTTLDDWLRNSFFEQHCQRFHNRPFVWHIWDGRKDGFSCLVNYHKLSHKALESLTCAYLQDWINAQAAAAKEGRTCADLRLRAAHELQAQLKLILAGEPPYDIVGGAIESHGWIRHETRIKSPYRHFHRPSLCSLRGAGTEIRRMRWTGASASASTRRSAMARRAS